MTPAIQKSNSNRTQLLMTTALVTAIGFVGATAAMAGTDTTFGSFETMLTGWMTGSLGKVVAVGGVLYSAFSLFRGQWGGLAVGLGVAAVMAFGPSVASGMFTGLI